MNKRSHFEPVKYDLTTKAFTGFFIFIIIVMVVLYVIHFAVDDSLLPRLILEWVIIPVRDIGIWGILLFFGFMVLQAIIAPIPSELVLMASGIIWGLLGGIFMGFAGSMITALLGYYIAYRGGRPIASGIFGEETVKSMAFYVSKYGGAFIFAARAIPFLPYDLFTMVSGFTQMNVKRYALATGLGTIPRVIFYAWAGSTLAGDVDTFIAMLRANPGTAWANFQTSAYKLQFNTWLTVIATLVVIGFSIFYLAILPLMKRKYRTSIVLLERSLTEKTEIEKRIEEDLRLRYER